MVIWELINNYAKQKTVVGSQPHLSRNNQTIHPGVSFLPVKTLVKILLLPGMEGLGSTLLSTTKCMPFLMQTSIFKAKVEL